MNFEVQPLPDLIRLSVMPADSKERITLVPTAQTRRLSPLARFTRSAVSG